jgi:phosphoribosylformylglycinamidine cyclo-ligase
MRVVKDNLFDTPPVFRLIRQASGADDREMFQVFNMGCRMEIYTDASAAEGMMAVAKRWGVEARIIGRVEASPAKSLQILHGDARLEF